MILLFLSLFLSLDRKQGYQSHLPTLGWIKQDSLGKHELSWLWKANCGWLGCYNKRRKLWYPLYFVSYSWHYLYLKGFQQCIKFCSFNISIFKGRSPTNFANSNSQGSRWSPTECAKGWWKGFMGLSFLTCMFVLEE